MLACAYFIEIVMPTIVDNVVMIPKTVPEWLKKKFTKYNKYSPDSWAMVDLIRDATYDLEKHFDGTKAQLTTAVKVEVEAMASRGEIEKDGSYYISDYYHAESSYAKEISIEQSPATEKKQEKQKKNSRVQNVINRRRKKSKPASGNQLFLKSLGE